MSLITMSIPGAVKLGREYLARRGGERLEEETLQSLAITWEGNPLTIRLTIDSYLAGTELVAALKQTRENILVFSYTSLLEALPAGAIDTLEEPFRRHGAAITKRDCLFVRYGN